PPPNPRYYLLSSKWSELPGSAVIAEPSVVKTLDMATCTLEDSRGVSGAKFGFKVDGSQGKVCSGFAGWFTSDFKSRTDEEGRDAAPKVDNPVLLDTGPANGYTHWGQQVFHLTSPINLLPGEETSIDGSLDMIRTKENVRLYNVKLDYDVERKNVSSGIVLNKSKPASFLYQIP
ncbi:hypothetical protein TeGR_g6646, partial [Tetraparma gracilis]